METTLTINIGDIIAAAAPTIALLIAAFMQHKVNRASNEKLTGIHKLANSRLTHEKQSRLDVLVTTKVMIEKLSGLKPSVDEKALVDDLNKQIELLRLEILDRDEVAGSITKAQE